MMNEEDISKLCSKMVNDVIMGMPDNADRIDTICLLSTTALQLLSLAKTVIGNHPNRDKMLLGMREEIEEVLKIEEILNDQE